MRTLTMMALALVLTTPALAQQASTQAQQDAQRRELREKMRELQQQMRELEREMARLEPERRATVRAYAEAPAFARLFGNRARLGVYVATAKNAATDSIGAVLDRVTPSGPGDKAGLKAGDIITTFNGEKLAGRYPAAGEYESQPARKLVDFVQELEEGDTVVVDYRRGRETHRATIVAKELGSEGFSFGFTTPTPDVRVNVTPKIEALTRLPMIAWSSGWLDLELVALNPELGEYFGTTNGLLVVRAPEDSELQVKGGDVILSVDGRPTTSQAQLMRILRSYEAGEDVKLDIMRQKRRTNLTVKIPERVGRHDGFEHEWDSDWNGR